jgi:hypothetical protein
LGRFGGRLGGWRFRRSFGWGGLGMRRVRRWREIGLFAFGLAVEKGSLLLCIREFGMEDC